MIVVWLLASALAAEGNTVLHQSTSGWCSPVIANVTGNVTVNCIGVDPRALQRLNAQLSSKNQQLTAKIAEANQWVDRYRELEQQLKQTGLSRELSKQAIEYVHQGDFDKAKTVLDQLLAADAKDVDRIAADYYQRGLLEELQFKPVDAIADFERAHQLDPTKVTFAERYARLLVDQHEFAKAEPVLGDAIARGREGVAKDPLKYRERFAMLLYSRAIMFHQSSRFAQAEADMTEAISQFRQLAKEKPDYPPMVFYALLDLATVYESQRRFDAAEAATREALALQRSFPASEMKSWALAGCLSNLALIAVKTGRTDEAIASLQEEIGILREAAKTKPALYEADLGLALNNMAAAQHAAGRLSEAEQYAREAVEVTARAAAADPGRNQGEAAGALRTLGTIQLAEHHYQEADATFRKALPIARDLVKKSQDAYEVDLAKLLGFTAANYAAMNQYRDADAAYREALEIWRRLASSSFEAGGEEQASTAGALAGVYLQEGDTAAAGPLLREAVDTYRRLDSTRPGQSDAAMADDLQKLAVVYLSQKDLVHMREASEAGLAIFTRLRSSNAQFNHESMARCMMLFAAATERENPSRACAMVRDAADVATDAVTRQGAVQAFQQCSRRTSFRR